MSVFIIAEAGSSWDCDLQKAFRLIHAAKECGADAVKFQWTSSADKMTERRNLRGTDARVMYFKYLEKPVSWLESLKAHADKVGIEFMCTVYLIEDIATIAPLVKRFKISAYESKWRQFVEAHVPYRKELIISTNPGRPEYHIWDEWMNYTCNYHVLHCVSQYPTPIEKLGLRLFHDMELPDGLSDHTANVLTGAAAVAAGARIVEAHIRLQDTDPGNPDYKHSLNASTHWYLSDPGKGPPHGVGEFYQYVQNIRTVERML